MLWLLALVYAYPTFVSLSNLILMRRPRLRGRAEAPSSELAVLIPARDEEANLRRLIPALLGPNPGLRVYVFDDESSDRTGEVAAELGARVLRPAEPLPAGWTGKNRACDRLGRAAAEDSDAGWYLFLDADVQPGPDFIPGVLAFAASARPGVKVVTGFPTLLPGRGPEPLFLAWVGWVLLSTTPFGLAARTGLGHPRFTNGQMTAWRREVYVELWPNERLRGAILEDVKLGRLLAEEGVGLEVGNWSALARVRMYETWREALDGMSKNSYEITGTAFGLLLIAALFLLLAFAWLAAGGAWWIPFGLLAVNGALVAATVGASWLTGPAMPVVLTLGAVSLVRSLVWRRRGLTRWKGRVYRD